MAVGQLLSLVVLAAVANGAAVDLNGDNFEELVTSGSKNAFVKFLAPW